MSKSLQIPVEIRTDRGKGASRRLRRAGLVPGILYGADRDAVALQIPHQFLAHALEDESFYTTILEVSVDDGRSQRVILRDLQRHPFKPQIMHIDFLRVSEAEQLTIKVPVHFAHEDESPAGKMSGVVISHQLTEVEISCLPKDLPEYLKIDLSQMDVGDVLHLSDIPLPPGVEIVDLVHGEDTNVVTASHVGPDAAELEAEAEAAAAAELEAEGEGEEADVDALETPEGKEAEDDDSRD